MRASDEPTVEDIDAVSELLLLDPQLDLLEQSSVSKFASRLLLEVPKREGGRSSNDRSGSSVGARSSDWPVVSE